MRKKSVFLNIFILEVKYEEIVEFLDVIRNRILRIDDS